MEKNASNGVDFGGRTRELRPGHGEGLEPGHATRVADPRTRKRFLAGQGREKRHVVLPLSGKKRHVVRMAILFCTERHVARWARNDLSFLRFWPSFANDGRFPSSPCARRFAQTTRRFCQTTCRTDMYKKKIWARGGACRGVFGQFFHLFTPFFNSLSFMCVQY